MKTNKILYVIFITILILLFLSGCKKNTGNQIDDSIYQYSTINALLEGIFEGQLSLNDLQKHGDFGIGTYNDLDGEMIVLDGIFYSIKSDGKVYVMDKSSKTPFTVITYFDVNKSLINQGNLDLKGLIKYLDENIPSKNLFYAFKIKGLFKYVKTRSVPKQNKPYPKLSEVTKNQPVFELNNINGTLIGFRVPEYAKGINVSGYHFHFIDDEKKSGGHLLDFNADNLNIEIDFSKEFFMDLPETGDFINFNLSGDKESEVKKVEK